VKTPTGRVFSAAQWIERHPVHGLVDIVPVVGGGVFNGSFMGTLGSMMEYAERQGCDFSDCATDEEKLARIEEFESRPKERAVTAEERIAAALEYQVMASLPDAE
jgi:hypothetical protein